MDLLSFIKGDGIIVNGTRAFYHNAQNAEKIGNGHEPEHSISRAVRVMAVSVDLLSPVSNEDNLVSKGCEDFVAGSV